ncbi:hypothetical protein [Paenibacillus sp. PAMC21692]|uniref:hypothetical protein n=1 Tax=Paenibacillus sp. PAMC21692 TaxID=2762320 RepID=UPI00164E2E7A|nr:hypothetical protein [Paenibacillus sp. PAMC21692]QNK57962.1 hypothetical protein H7F31_03055 [Paenibacillus sp. PAMC21692]
MTKMETNRMTELSVAQWQELIASCAREAASSQYERNYGIEVRSKMRPFMSEMTPEEAWLFELNALLFLLGKQANGRQLSYSAQMAVSETVHALESHLHSGLLPEVAVKQTGRLLETTAYMRETALGRAWTPPFYLDIYAELWISLISSKAEGHRLLQEELAHLTEAVETANAAQNGELRNHARSAADVGATFGSGSSKGNGLFPLVARAWMHFWLEEDQQAWRLLGAAERHGLELEQVFRFLRLLEKSGNWIRLEAWLSHCANEQVGRSPRSLGEYGRYWDAVVEVLPEAEERMWSALASLPPYCSSLYVEKLMRYGRSRQWIDYQLSHGSDPFGFRAKDLQPIEKEAPEALLPFYHQGVERYVLQKNRDGYKRAVKLLKRLAKLYKKLKREQRWETYIETFAGRHSRLRALQEELRKGGLIP